eukprot:c21108_g1_i1 orf=237-569(+)
MGPVKTKPYVLRLMISLKYTSALVVHRPTKTCAASASSQERELKKTFDKSPASVTVALQIGEILAQRLAAKRVTRVHLNLEKEAIRQERDIKRFHALITSLLANGIEILP